MATLSDSSRSRTVRLCATRFCFACSQIISGAEIPNKRGGGKSHFFRFRILFFPLLLLPSFIFKFNGLLSFAGLILSIFDALLNLDSHHLRLKRCFSQSKEDRYHLA